MKLFCSSTGRIRKRMRAFTLVEVVMSMGIFGFAIVIILSLLSTLVLSSRDSWMQTRSAHLARQIADDLLADPAYASNTVSQANADIGLVMQMTNSAIQVPLLATSITTNIVYYTTDGIATNQAAAVFQAQIILQPLPIEPATNSIPARSETQLEVDIRPAGQANASPYKFFTVMTPQGSD